MRSGSRCAIAIVFYNVERDGRAQRSVACDQVGGGCSHFRSNKLTVKTLATVQCTEYKYEQFIG